MDNANNVDKFSLFKDDVNGSAVWTYNVVEVLSVNSTIQMKEFEHIFFSILLWMAVSYIFVHSVAVIVAMLMLRRHPYAVFVVIPMLGMAIIGPVTLGAVTSAILAVALTTANKVVSPIYCLILGVIQTLITVIISYSRILATL